MALGGLGHIIDDPGILAAFNPAYGTGFIVSHGSASLLVPGAVFLAVTGAEAPYADMGHFGAKPIRVAWFGLAFPALALNYLGQGAMLLAHPEHMEKPFFLLYPSWALLPMVLRATMATIIASQAVITGTFSITQQPMQVGLLPRMRVLRTLETEKGQIYIPLVNLAAGGRCVPGGRAQVAECARRRLRHRSHRQHGHHRNPDLRRGLEGLALVARPGGPVDRPFLELVFLSGNAFKLFQGGWLPLPIGAGLVFLMWI